MGAALERDGRSFERNSCKRKKTVPPRRIVHERAMPEQSRRAALEGQCCALYTDQAGFLATPLILHGWTPRTSRGESRQIA